MLIDGQLFMLNFSLGQRAEQLPDAPARMYRSCAPLD